jgi:hypothetical protein
MTLETFSVEHNFYAFMFAVCWKSTQSSVFTIDQTKEINLTGSKGHDSRKETIEIITLLEQSTPSSPLVVAHNLENEHV